MNLEKLKKTREELKKINDTFELYYLKVSDSNKKEFFLLLKHVKAVEDLSLKILNEFEINDPLLIEKVRFISLFHDIGRLKCEPFGKSPMILHGLYSKKIMVPFLNSINFSQDVKEELLQGLVSHVGVGFKKQHFLDLMRKMNIDLRDYGLEISEDLIPKTLTQKLVCYADNLIYTFKEIPFHTALVRFYKSLGVSFAKRFINLQSEVFNELILLSEEKLRKNQNYL